jgi:hypothetical protein
MSTLKIKQDGIYSTGCTIEYNGQEMHCFEVDLKMVACEIPQVRFTVQATELDIELQEAIPTSEQLIEGENVLLNQNDIIIIRYPRCFEGASGEKLYARNALKASFEHFFPEHKVLLISKNLDLEILRAGVLKTHNVE